MQFLNVLCSVLYLKYFMLSSILGPRYVLYYRGLGRFMEMLGGVDQDLHQILVFNRQKRPEKSY